MSERKVYVLLDETYSDDVIVIGVYASEENAEKGALNAAQEIWKIEFGDQGDLPATIHAINVMLQDNNNKRWGTSFAYDIQEAPFDSQIDKKREVRILSDLKCMFKDCKTYRFSEVISGTQYNYRYCRDHIYQAGNLVDGIMESKPTTGEEKNPPLAIHPEGKAIG